MADLHFDYEDIDEAVKFVKEVRVVVKDNGILDYDEATTYTFHAIVVLMSRIIANRIANELTNLS